MTTPWEPRPEDHASRAALATDRTLTPRLVVVMVRVALAVLAEPALPDTDPPEDRMRQNARRQVIRDVLADLPAWAGKLQWAVGCAAPQVLTQWCAGGPDAVDDALLDRTVARLWDGLGMG